MSVVADSKLMYRYAIYMIVDKTKHVTPRSKIGVTHTRTPARTSSSGLRRVRARPTMAIRFCAGMPPPIENHRDTRVREV
jgi:hypothetical protein